MRQPFLLENERTKFGTPSLPTKTCRCCPIQKWGRRQNPTKWFRWEEDDEMVSTEQFIRWVDGYEREHSLRTKKVG
ncbi:MAG: hypothetical protein V8Q30_04645, partial [Acutalibacteraceae bacterium]